MIGIGEYLILESVKDLSEDEWNRKEESLICEGVIHHKGDRENYPQFYKYCEPWDYHCCGEYWLCDKKEVFEEIHNRKAYYEKLEKVFQ